MREKVLTWRAKDKKRATTEGVLQLSLQGLPIREEQPKATISKDDNCTPGGKRCGDREKKAFLQPRIHQVGQIEKQRTQGVKQ